MKDDEREAAFTQIKNFEFGFVDFHSVQPVTVDDIERRFSVFDFDDLLFGRPS